MMKSRRGTLAYLGAAALAAACARVDADAEAAALTPAETEGPFFPENTAAERDADLTRLAGRAERAAGQVIEVRVRVLNASGQPVSGARAELWQANAAGRYAHTLDAANSAPLDPNFQGYALLESGADGGFSVITIKPGGYMVAEEGPRTPHLHWKIAAGARQLTTQSYFPGEPANETDFLIRAMRDPVQRLIMTTGAAGAEGAPAFDWDIVLPA